MTWPAAARGPDLSRASRVVAPESAPALASHISRGGYGRNVHVARGEMGNKGEPDGDREHWAVLFFLNRVRWFDSGRGH